MHWQRFLSVSLLYKGGSGSGVGEVFHFVCNGDTVSEVLSAAAVVAARLGLTFCCDASDGARADSGFSCDAGARPRGAAMFESPRSAGGLVCDAAALEEGLLRRLRLGEVTPFSSNTSADAGFFCDAVAAAGAAVAAPSSLENAP